MERNKNIWKEKHLTHLFDNYDDTLEFKFLFVPLIEKLKEEGVNTILDYGCGSGKLTNELSKLNGAEVYGIDISKDAITIAKSRDKKSKYILIPEERHLLDKKIFDIIICSFLFVTINEYKHFLSLINEMKSILKTNGKLYIFEFNLEALGLDFYYFKTEKKKNLNMGDRFKVTMRTYQNTFFEFQDFYWDEQTIVNALINSGFRIDCIKRDRINYKENNIEVVGEPFYTIEATKVL